MMSEIRSAIDSMFDACHHQRRRIVFAILDAERRSLTLNDLAQTVLEYNRRASPTEVSGDVLSETRLSLHHVHLPKLASDGFITYDPDRHLVESTERFEQVQPTVSTVLDADPTLETPIEL